MTAIGDTLRQLRRQRKKLEPVRQFVEEQNEHGPEDLGPENFSRQHTYEEELEDIESMIEDMRFIRRARVNYDPREKERHDARIELHGVPVFLWLE